jgi:integrase
MRTTFTEENEGFEIHRTNPAQNPASSGGKMKFPVKIKHRRAKAVIYGKTAGYDFYRVAIHAAGKRCLKSFQTYSEAKEYAEAKVRELARGDQAAALTPKESTDTLTIRTVLDDFRRDTGRSVTALEAVKAYLHAMRKLGDRQLDAAVDGYLANVATLTRKDVGEAVTEFLQSRQPLTQSAKGERSQLSGKYAYNLEIQLRSFAATFPGTALSDLTKSHLDAYFAALGEFSPKTRNHYRNAVKTLFLWAVRRDYLPPTHRLNESAGLTREKANTAEIEFYTPAEFRKLLAAADEPLRLLIAIGGLTGLRTAELLRLTWADLWRVPGFLEVTAQKAKTRQRRLIPICPALEQWLAPHRAQTEGLLWPGHEVTFQQHFRELCEAAGLPRKANGLRHSYVTFVYVLHGETVAAQNAGHAPAMLHANYRGLATREEAERWFAVAPAPVAANVVPISAAVA